MLFACLKLISHILAYALEHVLQRSFFLQGKAAKHDAIDATALIFPSGKGASAFLGDIEGTRATVATRNARQEAPALQRIEDSYFEEIRILDTIPMPKGYTGEKIKQLTVADMFAEAISHIYMETSVSPLFS